MKQTIITATLEAFDEHGIRFTMDDVANNAGISKRTLYEHIASKEALVGEIIELFFTDIKAQHLRIAQNESLEVTSKIKKIICLMPESKISVNTKKVYEIKKYYPNLYSKIDQQLAEGWEIVIDLFREGIDKKVLRFVNVQFIRQIFLGIFRSLIEDEFLIENNMAFTDALEEAVDIILKGLQVEDEMKMRKGSDSDH